jgi:hypothetical protein
MSEEQPETFITGKILQAPAGKNFTPYEVE